ncbi:two component, sigma54 specific, transcriptional regulator, Fis family protein [Minicystis rosea]|nr:two component, sigma54 specific, transcriptional regulator, Fis family protein [Minicystis rosea]
MSAPPAFHHPRYEAREELGRGAQGVVVRAVDREAPEARLVAKVLRAGAFHEASLAGEFALLSRARIPGLARAHDLARCTRTGAPFLVEDFAEGPEADAWVSAAASPASARAARLAKVIAEVGATLSLLHDAGFVHGDLKPAHVRMVTASGATRATLLDLGATVARGTIAFTPAFAAPEVAAGATPTALADLYGLGALAWAIAAGQPPDRGTTRPPLRSRAPWVPPAVADVVEALLAEHPRDRPCDAREVLRRLGVAQSSAGLAVARPPAPIGRERELAALLEDDGNGASTVRYLVGPSGSGKSHLAREVVTRALLAGRRARLLRFPAASGAMLAGVSAFLRGNEVALPFLEAEIEAPLLLVMDDVHAAPEEIRTALELYRCRAREMRRVQVIATMREAPDGSETVALGPLDDAGFAALCRAVGVREETAIERARVASGKNPGWLVASAGAVPLTQDTALDRLRSLSGSATEMLAAIALVGGEASELVCAAVADASAAGELLAAALVDRRGGERTIYTLTAPALAPHLATTLATFARVDRVADILLAQDEAPAAALLTLADAPLPPQRRSELLERAAAAARAEGLRAEELSALFALAADPGARSPELLLRLERLARDTGVAAAHPRVLDWLDEAAAKHPAVVPLSLRRRAEKTARDGDAEKARALAEKARVAAAGDPVGEALALGTLGLVSLFGAAYADAERALGEARARLAAVSVHDPEEIARIDHNLGVVALYRGRHEEAARAFERALAVKRELGDRAGMRSCLLNLGLALARIGRLDDADHALGEAERLARSLGQTAGRGWVLAALADVAVRRRDAIIAERRIAEAAALEQALPAAVRADLAILRAQVALLTGDGARAVAALDELDPTARAGDALIDARALAIEAEAILARLPVDRRGAARRAIAAVRRARAAGLPETEAQGLAALRAARERAGGVRYAARVSEPREIDGGGEALWGFLGVMAAGATRDEAAAALARLVAQAHGAERAFVAAVDASGSVREAWGVDLDGLPIAEPRARLADDVVRAATGREGPMYQRDVTTAGGRGARLAVAAKESVGGTRALVVLEHRFAPGAFDRVTAGEAQRWATLGALLLRLDRLSSNDSTARALPSPPVPAAVTPAPPPPAFTTAFPLSAPRRSFPGVVGQSPALLRALARLEAAAPGELPVLLVGETGSGKEVFARALHDTGPRAEKPFVAVNCGAIADSLFEAELFGHARGSFTGADRARAGLLARAHGGTLFLDEIGELPMSRQAALLRVLQERRYRPVGGDEEVSFDARIVAATNRDLERAVAERTFRQDLYYRLNAVEIRVPPLRERAEDVAELARGFLARAGSQAALSGEVVAALAAHAWPGNVRELEHVMQRLSLLGVPVIGIEHLPRQIRPATPPIAVSLPPASGERAEVERALSASSGNISRAAALLGLTRQGLKKRMVRLGMRAPRIDGEKTG